MTALPLAACAPLRGIRERIDRIDLADLLDGHEPARALWLDRLYRNFLFLCAIHPQEALAPPVPVDAVWRAHASEPERYAADCRAAFGWVPPRIILAAARERFTRRYRQEFLVDPLLPDARELIDALELERIEQLGRRVVSTEERPRWNPGRHLMTVAGDVAHWSGDLQAHLRRDGIAILEWEDGAPGRDAVLEQLVWTFGPPHEPEAPWSPLVVALLAGTGGAESVMVRGSAVWRCIRRRVAADILDAAGAPDALVIEREGRHVAGPLLPRLSRVRRGLCFSTDGTRVFAAPGVGPVFRAIGEIIHDPELELELRLEPGQLLVFDNLAWVERGAGAGAHRLCFSSPDLVGMGLGFRVV